MITADQSLPTRSASAAVGSSVVWQQFNDITIFVEDEGKEYFYTVVIRKILPGKRIGKLIPTKGKPNSLRLAQKYSADKSFVFLIDLDFDEILSTKLTLPNLFYLDRYSIENYLIEESALREYVRESHPEVSDTQANKVLKNLWQHHKKLLRTLTQCFILIQQRSLGVKYYTMDPARDKGFTMNTANPAHRQIVLFLNDVEGALKQCDGRRTLKGSLRSLQRFTDNCALIKKNCPGKYLMAVAKSEIEREFRIPQSTTDAFCYRMAKNCNFPDLQPLGARILAYCS